MGRGYRSSVSLGRIYAERNRRKDTLIYPLQESLIDKGTTYRKGTNIYFGVPKQDICRERNRRKDYSLLHHSITHYPLPVQLLLY